MSDIISREDAREAIEDLMDIHFDRQVVLAKARDAIVSLPSAVCDDCIWHVCNYNKVDWDGEDGYISKRDALAEFRDGRDVYDIMESIESLPSAEPKLMEDGTLEVNVHDARLVKRVLIGDEKHWGGLYYPDAEPETEMVLCALADRACPFQGKEFAWCLTCPHISEEDRNLVKKAVSEPKTGWIPIKWHEITEEEREREGYPKDWVVHIDCDMPCDGDEILVQTKNGYIRWDVCYEDGEFSLDSGWDWIEDIVAWMPLPEPYKAESEE